jgi:hypothetical protein
VNNNLFTKEINEAAIKLAKKLEWFSDKKLTDSDLEEIMHALKEISQNK